MDTRRTQVDLAGALVFVVSTTTCWPVAWCNLFVCLLAVESKQHCQVRYATLARIIFGGAIVCAVCLLFAAVLAATFLRVDWPETRETDR